jgi:hypothetical protein
MSILYEVLMSWIIANELIVLLVFLRGRRP